MRKKTIFNPELLKEELNRFKMLEGYSFYAGKQELPEYKELIVGDANLDEEEEELEIDATTDGEDTSADDISAELGLDAPEGDEADLDAAPEVAPEPAPAPPPPAAPEAEGVEVDVTELVKGSEDAKMAAEKASHNSEMLLQKLADLESRVASMDAVGAKIEELEKEIIKRNPTPVEKLEMRSLSSYPYSQKLTDYWADKEGPYDVMDKKKEYTLTQDDVDNFSDGDITKSFTVDDNEFEEEDY